MPLFRLTNPPAHLEDATFAFETCPQGFEPADKPRPKVKPASITEAAETGEIEES